MCEKVVFRHEHSQRLLQTPGKSPQAELLRSTFVGRMFAKDKNFTHFVWDVLMAAALIDPSLITADRTLNIDVNTESGS
ncbi:MAG: hypothetical protein ACOX5Z_01020 [Desulfobulbus sp.]